MDIVERLRPHGLMGQSAETRLRQEAADEIERLREALQFYANKKIYIGSFVDAEINWDKGFKARSALQQKETE